MAVIWITGLSNSGKTSIANLLFNKYKNKYRNLVLIDGDTIRLVFNDNIGYSYEDRLVSAYRNARLCKFLNDQNLIVICSTISMYEEVRMWNKNNINNYYEIYIRVPYEQLLTRDSRGVYKNKKSEIVNFKNGWDEPQSPNLIIDNINNSDLEIHVQSIALNCPYL
jgi:adenylylsulfate kinase-like enzyme